MEITLMAQLLAEHWQRMIDSYDHESPDLVLAVPCHFKRWQERGFNQAHLIAKRTPFERIFSFKTLQ